MPNKRRDTSDIAVLDMLTESQSFFPTHLTFIALFSKFHRVKFSYMTDTKNAGIKQVWKKY